MCIWTVDMLKNPTIFYSCIYEQEKLLFPFRLEIVKAQIDKLLEHLNSYAELHKGRCRKLFCVIFSNIFSLVNPQYFHCIPKSLGWQSLCNPRDEMFATFNEEIYETCGAEMLV